MVAPSSPPSVVRKLWLGRAALLTRLVASIASAALLGGLSLGALWGIMAASSGIQQLRFALPSATTRGGPVLTSYTMLRVDLPRMAILMAVLIGAVIWIPLLWRFWGPPRGTPLLPSASSQIGGNGDRKPGRLPLIIRAGAIIVLSVLAIQQIYASSFTPGDRRFMVTFVLLLAGGGLLAFGLGAIERVTQFGKSILDAEGNVDVRCPGCGYLLIGLRDLRCPECGMQFTIDELIRAQKYEAPPPAV